MPPCMPPGAACTSVVMVEVGKCDIGDTWSISNPLPGLDPFSWVYSNYFHVQVDQFRQRLSLGKGANVPLPGGDASPLPIGCSAYSRGKAALAEGLRLGLSMCHTTLAHKELLVEMFRSSVHAVTPPRYADNVCNMMEVVVWFGERAELGSSFGAGGRFWQQSHMSDPIHVPTLDLSSSSPWTYACEIVGVSPRRSNSEQVACCEVSKWFIFVKVCKKLKYFYFLLTIWSPFPHQSMLQLHAVHYWEIRLGFLGYRNFYNCIFITLEKIFSVFNHLFIPPPCFLTRSGVLQCPELIHAHFSKWIN